MKCDICSSNEFYIKEYEHIYTIKGREVKFSSSRKFCSKCDNLIYDPELDNETGLKAIELYNKEYGLSKDQIIELRNKYNLSQELFSKIIGCAKKTLISYEKGTSIPNDNYVIIINSLISNPGMIETLIEANKNQFSAKEYQKIQDRIANFLAENLIDLEFDDDYVLSEYNGYTKPNKNKINNIILYFADKCVLKTKLLKEMFYADFLHYKKTGSSITGLEYAKLNYGPVPEQFEKILNACAESKLISYQIDYKNDYEYHNIQKNTDANTQIFLPSELETINQVRNFFADFNSKDIVEFSHAEKAFTETDFYKKISYDYAFDIDRIN